MSLAESYPIWSEKGVEEALDANFVSGETEHVWEAQLTLLDDIEETTKRWCERRRRLVKENFDGLWLSSSGRHAIEAAELWTNVLRQSNACLVEDTKDMIRLYLRATTGFWTI